MDDVDYRSVEDYGRDEETHQVYNTNLIQLTRFANHNIFYLLKILIDLWHLKLYQ